MNTMQAVWISSFGGPEGLEIRQVGKPLITSEQVLVRVRASALNRADLLQRQGKYPPPPGGEVSFDLRVLVNSPLFWLVALAAFALGFYWEFRRTR